MARISGHVLQNPIRERLKKHFIYSHGLKYLMYRLQWNLAPKLGMVTRFPTHLDVEPTNSCNLRCIMCGRNFLSEKLGFISFPMYKDIINEASRSGVYSLKLNLRGEPLLHPQLAEMVKYAKSKRILEVMFNTNGVLLNEKKARDLIEAQLDLIIISVDGFKKETYERIRTGANYDQLMENIHRFLELRKKMGRRKPLLRIQIVKMEENASEVEDIISYWQPHADYVAINKVAIWEGHKNRSTEQFQTAGRVVCFQPWQRLIVDWNGDIMMCCWDWNKLNLLGNFRDTSLTAVWHSKELNKIRELIRAIKMDKIKACKICGRIESYNWKERNDNLISC